MKIYAVVPVKELDRIKSRLSPILTLEQRQQLTLHMLEDVLTSIKDSGVIDEAVVVSPDDRVLKFASAHNALTLKETRSTGVNTAVHKADQLCLQRGVEATLILPADIPLLTPLDVRLLVECCKPHSVVVAPSLNLDGTNALVRSPPRIMETSYDQDSFNTHVKISLNARLKLTLYLSFNVMLDIDTVEDLRRLLSCRGRSLTQRYLTEMGLHRL